MKIGIVPGALIAKTRRLDADFYIGEQAEQKIARTKRTLALAKQRLARQKQEKKQRDLERKKLGIKRFVTRIA